MNPTLDKVLMYSFTIGVLAAIVALYFLPSFCARNKRHKDGIQRLNLYLGWTGIGWLAALIWAVWSPRKQHGTPLGSGPLPIPPSTALRSGRFDYPKYVMREELKLVGKKFHIYGPNGDELCSADMKAFKLREDIRLYAGEDQKTEVLLIKAREIFDVSATYDVVDPVARETVGAIKRRGLRSLVRDEWVILDPGGQQLVEIKEEHILLALLRRFLISLVPQQYIGLMHERAVCVFKQHWNPFVLNMSVDFSEDINRTLDRRLGLAAAVLLCTVEGKEH